MVDFGNRNSEILRLPTSWNQTNEVGGTSWNHFSEVVGTSGNHTSEIVGTSGNHTIDAGLPHYISIVLLGVFPPLCRSAPFTQLSLTFSTSYTQAQSTNYVCL